MGILDPHTQPAVPQQTDTKSCAMYMLGVAERVAAEGVGALVDGTDTTIVTQDCIDLLRTYYALTFFAQAQGGSGAPDEKVETGGKVKTGWGMLTRSQTGQAPKAPGNNPKVPGKAPKPDGKADKTPKKDLKKDRRRGNAHPKTKGGSDAPGPPSGPEGGADGEDGDATFDDDDADDHADDHADADPMCVPIVYIQLLGQFGVKVGRTTGRVEACKENATNGRTLTLAPKSLDRALGKNGSKSFFGGYKTAVLALVRGSMSILSIPPRAEQRAKELGTEVENMVKALTMTTGWADTTNRQEGHAPETCYREHPRSQPGQSPVLDLVIAIQFLAAAGAHLYKSNDSSGPTPSALFLDELKAPTAPTYTEGDYRNRLCQTLVSLPRVNVFFLHSNDRTLAVACPMLGVLKEAVDIVRGTQCCVCASANAVMIAHFLLSIYFMKLVVESESDDWTLITRESIADHFTAKTNGHPVQPLISVIAELHILTLADSAQALVNLMRLFCTKINKYLHDHDAPAHDGPQAVPHKHIEEQDIAHYLCQQPSLLGERVQKELAPFPGNTKNLEQGLPCSGDHEHGAPDTQFGGYSLCCLFADLPRPPGGWPAGEGMRPASIKQLRNGCQHIKNTPPASMGALVPDTVSLGDDHRFVALQAAVGSLGLSMADMDVLRTDGDALETMANHTQVFGCYVDTFLAVLLLVCSGAEGQSAGVVSEFLKKRYITNVTCSPVDKQDAIVSFSQGVAVRRVVDTSVSGLSCRELIQTSPQVCWWISNLALP